MRQREYGEGLIIVVDAIIARRAVYMGLKTHEAVRPRVMGYHEAHAAVGTLSPGTGPSEPPRFDEDVRLPGLNAASLRERDRLPVQRDLLEESAMGGVMPRTRP